MAERFNAIAIPGISALLGAVAGTLVTLALTRSGPRVDTPARPEPSLATDPASSRDPSVDARLDSLERSLRALALKDSVARAAPPDASAHAGEPAPVANVAPIVDNPVFEAAVRDVMDRAEQERSLERESQRTEWRKRTAEEFGAKLGEKLRLTEIQKAKATAIAQTFWDRLREARQTDAGPPPSREEWREKVAALRKTSEAELAQVLDHAQLTTYGELDDAEKLGSLRNIRAAQRGSP